MTPGDPFTFLWYFIGIGSIFVIVPAVESYRTDRSIFVALPVLFGLLSQVLTIGATTPLYWLVFFLSGGRSRFDNATPVTKAHAEAMLFGLFAGAAVPSICMLVMQDPTITAIWQPYPIYVSLATLLHLAVRRPNYTQPGFSIIQLFYLVAFVLASSVHFAAIWPRLSDLEDIKALLVPSLAPLTGADASTQILDFLKWDFTFRLLSMGIAQLWFVSDLIEIPFILFWYFIAVPFCSPGAAIIAVNLGREGQIGDRLAIIKEKES